MKNYYEILEVNEHASQDIVQKVYKILAKKYHPDLQKDFPVEGSEDKFKDISEAYETLSDEEKRKKYDEQLEFFKNSQESATIQELQNYCTQLENELSAFKGAVPKFKQSYHETMSKVYQDAYVDNLKKAGYKVKEKLTFKKFMRNFMVWLLTAIVIIIFAIIVWHIPALKSQITSTFSIFNGFGKTFTP